MALTNDLGRRPLVAEPTAAASSEAAPTSEAAPAAAPAASAAKAAAAAAPSRWPHRVCGILLGERRVSAAREGRRRWEMGGEEGLLGF